MINNTDKKAQIIEAAEALFLRFGYAKTSLDDIAGQAGLGKGTIYYYFESKEDIFFEIAMHHSEEFYSTLIKMIEKAGTFEEKFTIAVQQPIKSVYEHAPILMDAMKNLPDNYLQKLDPFRSANRKRMVSILDDVITLGIKEGIITESVPAERIVQIIFDWFLLGDTNLIIKHPEEFIKKAEQDYKWIVQLLLFGIIKRGDIK
jgi:TetR/AcrR family transcriptional regulator